MIKIFMVLGLCVLLAGCCGDVSTDKSTVIPGSCYTNKLDSYTTAKVTAMTKDLATTYAMYTIVSMDSFGRMYTESKARTIADFKEIYEEVNCSVFEARVVEFNIYQLRDRIENLETKLETLGEKR